MNTINITTELSKEDRKLLEELLGAVTLLASVIGSTLPKETVLGVIEEATEPVKTDTPAENTPEPATPVEEAPAATPIVISLAEFQKAVTLAVSKGSEAKKAVKEIINKYAASVSAVPEDKRAAVVAELAKI